MFLRNCILISLKGSVSISSAKNLILNGSVFGMGHKTGSPDSFSPKIFLILPVMARYAFC